ncbi:MAG: hypothetical protein JJ872_08930 [Marivivens sp.]|nr:hypothetical protein [Marivivens sp.]
MKPNLKRRIPSLLLDGPHAAKSFEFTDWQYVGDPVQIARLFSEKEVDELIVLDPSVSRDGRAINKRLLEKIAQQFHGPITYGGGVRDPATARMIVGLGFEKVALNRVSTAADPAAISELSAAIGEQAITLVIDIITTCGALALYDYRNGRSVPISPDELLVQVNAAQVGEVVLQFVDRDGTSAGLERMITREIASRAKRQVVVSGGAESYEAVAAYLQDSPVSGVIASSLYTFFPQTRSVLINYG